MSDDPRDDRSERDDPREDGDERTGEKGDERASGKDEEETEATGRDDEREDAPMRDLARDRLGATDDDPTNRPGRTERDDSPRERRRDAPDVSAVDDGDESATGDRNDSATDDRSESATDEHDTESATDGDASGERTPLSDLAADVRERRERESSDVESLFSEMDVGELDGERAWRDLLAADEDEPIAIGEPVETDEDRDVRIIENRTCHRCPYFADPPDFHCNHEGTEIRRVVDTDHFEVVDCPMVVDEDDLDVVGLE